MGNPFTREFNTKYYDEEVINTQAYITDELNKVKTSFKILENDIIEKLINLTLKNSEITMRNLDDKLNEFISHFTLIFNSHIDQIKMCEDITYKKILINDLRRMINNHEETLHNMVEQTVDKELIYMTKIYTESKQIIENTYKLLNDNALLHKKLLTDEIDTKKATFDSYKITCSDECIEHCNKFYANLKSEIVCNFSNHFTQISNIIDERNKILLALTNAITDIKTVKDTYQYNNIKQLSEYNYQVRKLVDFENYLDSICSKYTFINVPINHTRNYKQFHRTYAPNNKYDSCGVYERRHRKWYMIHGVINVSKTELIVIQNHINVKITHNELKIQRIEFDNKIISGIINYEQFDIIIKSNIIQNAILIHINVDHQIINEPCEYDISKITNKTELHFPFKLPIITESITDIYKALNNVLYKEYIDYLYYDEKMCGKVPITLECNHSKVIDKFLVEDRKLYFCDNCNEKKHII